MAIAVGIAIALGPRGFFRDASGSVRVAGPAVGANAFIPPFLVDAMRSVSARLGSTFVDIGAPLVRIATETRFAHTFRRIAGRTPRVDPARKSFTRTCKEKKITRTKLKNGQDHFLVMKLTFAFVSVECVGVKR